MAAYAIHHRTQEYIQTYLRLKPTYDPKYFFLFVSTKRNFSVIFELKNALMATPFY